MHWSLVTMVGLGVLLFVTGAIVINKSSSERVQKHAQACKERCRAVHAEHWSWTDRTGCCSCSAAVEP